MAVGLWENMLVSTMLILLSLDGFSQTFEKIIREEVRQNAIKNVVNEGSVIYGKPDYQSTDGNPSLWFYRRFISEQISAECAFDLSCSNFASKSLITTNPIKAIFLTVDRLTRCHPHAAEETTSYYFNNQSGKVIDDPSMY